MGNVTAIGKWKTAKKVQVHPVDQPLGGSGASIFTPATLSGVIIPWTKMLHNGKECGFKLVCSSGLEYFIIAESEWKDVLSWYSWEDVKVIGLLNTTNMTLIPRKIFPKDPKGKNENVIDLNAWKRRIKKVDYIMNKLILVPAAIWAVSAVRA